MFMRESLTVYVNGCEVTVPRGSTVVVAVLLSEGVSRTSISGHPRGPLCGMGTCFECRVKINGEPHRRGCLVACEAKMEIVCLG
jgi:D-hydroxyproline dehydrogenase subunit gamma